MCKEILTLPGLCVWLCVCVCVCVCVLAVLSGSCGAQRTVLAIYNYTCLFPPLAPSSARVICFLSPLFVCVCVCVCVCVRVCVCVCAAIVRIFWMSSLLFETHLPHSDHRDVVFLKRSAALCHVWSSVNVKPHTARYCLYLASQICLALGIHWHLFFTDDTVSEIWPFFHQPIMSSHCFHSLYCTEMMLTYCFRFKIALPTRKTCIYDM